MSLRDAETGMPEACAPQEFVLLSVKICEGREDFLDGIGVRPSSGAATLDKQGVSGLSVAFGRS